MTPEPANLGETHHNSGARQRLKCSYCRRDKQKCEPIARQWPEKCARCIQKKRTCGPNEKAEKRNRKRRRRRQSANLSMISSYTSQHTDSEALSLPQITLKVNNGRVNESADSRDGHLTGFRRSQSTSLLQIPAPSPAESASSITEETEDEPSLEDLYKLRLFYELVLLRDRALLPCNVTQHDLKQTLFVSNNLGRMAESAFSTRCTQMIDYIEGEDKNTAEQQYQDILVCMECDHTKKRSDMLVDTWKRLQHKIIKARLMDGRHFEACLRKIKVNESSVISNSPRSRKRLVEWCACVSECSKQLATVNDNLKMTSGSPYPSANPAPLLHLALILRLEHEVFPKLLSTQIDSLREYDLLNRNVLHVAAECSSSAAIQYILRHKPKEAAELIHERDRVSRTPILVAAYRSDLGCFKLLAGAGANLHDLDVGSLGVLELACRAGNKDIVEFLIDHIAGFSPNGRVGPHAPNPLHNAAKGNFRDVCDFLLARGADASMPDLSTGKTAARLAYDHDHHQLAWDLCAHDESGLSRTQLETPEWLNQLGLDDTNFMSISIYSGA